MPRVISFIVLLAIVLLVGAVFFQVMAQFFVPLFLACVLIVIFEPLHRWFGDRLPERPRVAAMLTTIAIILVVVLPLAWLGWKAYRDFDALLDNPGRVVATAPAKPPSEAPQPQPNVGETTPDATAATKPTVDEDALTHKLTTFVADLVIPIAHRAHLNQNIDDATIYSTVKQVSGFAAKSLISGVRSAIGVVVSLFILVIALYYFLADGPAMVEAVMAVSPLDRRYEHELLQRFSEVSRAVVVATLVAAITQGAFASIGYAFVLPQRAPIFLLTALTTVFALIPIFGAFAVWGCVSIWIYVQGSPVAAISLAIYCTIVVSLIDNIMKPLILHGQSKLHPLLALLSILGGIEAFGPVGLLVGPMLVSFLQALLNMLRRELDSFGEPPGPHSKPLAESVAEAFQLANAEDTTLDARSPDPSATRTSDSIDGQKSRKAAKEPNPRRDRRKR